MFQLFKHFKIMFSVLIFHFDLIFQFYVTFYSFKICSDDVSTCKLHIIK